MCHVMRMRMADAGERLADCRRARVRSQGRLVVDLHKRLDACCINPYVK
jgi:hypothetical protein